MWMQMKTSSRLLQPRQWRLGSDKRQGFSWPAGILIASQDGLCSMTFRADANLGSSDWSGEDLLKMNPLKFCVLLWPWCSFTSEIKLLLQNCVPRLNLCYQNKKISECSMLENFHLVKVLIPSIMGYWNLITYITRKINTSNKNTNFTFLLQNVL